MAKPTGKLTDSAIRAAKPPPEGKVKLYDDSYLYLRVQKRTKSWCWRYRLRGSDNTVYPWAVDATQPRLRRAR